MNGKIPPPFGGANILNPPETSSKQKGQRSAVIKDDMYNVNLTSDPAQKLFQHMHRMSMKAGKKVADGRVDRHSFEDVSESCSDMTVSTLSDKVKPLSRGCVIIGSEEESRIIPRYLIEEDNTGEAEKRYLKKYTRSLLDRSRETNKPGRITAILRYKERVIYVMKTINYTMTPTSALKVQWRIARSLLTPSFVMVFSMLNRYGTVFALIKCTSNSALCVYANIEQAQRALNMHSLNQSSKVLILSWWNQRYASTLINETTTTTKATSRWVENVCEGLLQSDELSKELLQDTSYREPPPPLQSTSRGISALSQRHKSSIMFELKKAFTKYSEYTTERVNSETKAGNLPLIEIQQKAGDCKTASQSVCKSKLDYFKTSKWQDLKLDESEAETE